jgi:hypothetical protein
MRNLTRAVISVATAGMLIGGAGYGVASADSGHDSVEGDGVFALGKFTFEGRTTSDDPRSATGYFKADPTAPADALLALRGPITCIVVDGNRAGFLYPVQDDSRPALLKSTAVLISLEDGGPGGTDHIGFVGPAPTATFPNCNPGPTPFDVTSGDVTVHDGS